MGDCETIGFDVIGETGIFAPMEVVLLGEIFSIKRPAGLRSCAAGKDDRLEYKRSTEKLLLQYFFRHRSWDNTS